MKAMNLLWSSGLGFMTLDMKAQFWIMVQPTGENGATRAPIVIQMQRGSGSGNRGLHLVVDGRSPSFVTASKVSCNPVACLFVVAPSDK